MKKEKCTLENPLHGHQTSWRYAFNYKYPVCGKCGLVVEPQK